VSPKARPACLSRAAAKAPATASALAKSSPAATERDTHLYGVAPGRVAVELWRTTAPASRIGSTTREGQRGAKGALGRSSIGEGGLSEANP
jgi:hypothetical protein